MRNFLFRLTIIILISGCSKDRIADAKNNFPGEYSGLTTKAVYVPGGPKNIQSYEMTIGITKTNNRELEILFGSWSTKAVLIGNKFTINKTNFSGPVTIYGNGTFKTGNSLQLNYIQTIASEITVSYSGTLKK